MKLYKKDIKGKLRVLNIFNQLGQLFQISGLVDGEKVGHIKDCVGKNIGKANETSPSEQAKLEMDALIKKKLREGYFKTQEEASASEVILPMLAKSYDKEKQKVDWNSAYVQPKLDGMRCLAFLDNGNVTLMSRKGVEITTMPHIVEELKTLKLDDIILDGELYLHGESFQENMKLIKKYREGQSEKIKYCVYDVVNEDKNYTDRKINIIGGSENILIVPTFRISNEIEMYVYHKEFLRIGYEGTILRHGDDGYKINGRSSSLLKVKDFIDEAFKVIDVMPMDVYRDQGILICEMEDGRKFKATPKMSHEDKKELLENKEEYIGKTAEIRFFEYTDDGFPRFPICVGFRLDK